MGRPKTKGYTLQKRGTKWTVYHRYTADGNQVGIATGETDETKAEFKAIKIIKDARYELEVPKTQDGEHAIFSDEANRIDNEINELTGKVLPEFDTLIDQYKKSAKYNTYSPNDKKKRIYVLSAFFTFLKDKKDTHKIRHCDYDMMKEYFALFGNKQTVYSYATIISAFFTWAKHEKIVSSNPIKLHEFKLSHKEKTKRTHDIVPFTDTQIKAIQNVLTNHERDYLFFAIAINTGMRSTEITQLLWSSINLESMEIRVRENTENKALEILASRVKTDTSVRIIPMPETLRAYLSKYRESHKMDVYVIKTKRNRTVAYKWSETYINKLKTICPDFHSHLCRHTYISKALHANVPASTVSHWTGNSVDIILKTYSHYIAKQDVNTFLNIPL